MLYILGVVLGMIQSRPTFVKVNMVIICIFFWKKKHSMQDNKKKHDILQNYGNYNMYLHSVDDRARKIPSLPSWVGSVF